MQLYKKILIFIPLLCTLQILYGSEAQSEVLTLLKQGESPKEETYKVDAHTQAGILSATLNQSQMDNLLDMFKQIRTVNAESESLCARLANMGKTSKAFDYDDDDELVTQEFNELEKVLKEENDPSKLTPLLQSPRLQKVLTKKNNHGETLLMVGAYKSSDVMFRPVVAQWPSYLVNAKDPEGHSALNYAATNGKADNVKLLLLAKADVQANKEKTPLQLAVQQGHLAVTQTLLAHMKQSHDIENNLNDIQQTLPTAKTFGAVYKDATAQDRKAIAAELERAHQELTQKALAIRAIALQQLTAASANTTQTNHNPATTSRHTTNGKDSSTTEEQKKAQELKRQKIKQDLARLQREKERKERERRRKEEQVQLERDYQHRKKAEEERLAIEHKRMQFEHAALLNEDQRAFALRAAAKAATPPATPTANKHAQAKDQAPYDIKKSDGTLQKLEEEWIARRAIVINNAPTKAEEIYEAEKAKKAQEHRKNMPRIPSRRLRIQQAKAQKQQAAVATPKASPAPKKRSEKDAQKTAPKTQSSAASLGRDTKHSHSSSTNNKIELTRAFLRAQHEETARINAMIARERNLKAQQAREQKQKEEEARKAQRVKESAEMQQKEEYTRQNLLNKSLEYCAVFKELPVVQQALSQTPLSVELIPDRPAVNPDLLSRLASSQFFGQLIPPTVYAGMAATARARGSANPANPKVIGRPPQ